MVNLIGAFRSVASSYLHNSSFPKPARQVLPDGDHLHGVGLFRSSSGTQAPPMAQAIHRPVHEKIQQDGKNEHPRGDGVTAIRDVKVAENANDEDEANIDRISQLANHSIQPEAASQGEKEGDGHGDEGIDDEAGPQVAEAGNEEERQDNQHPERP
jgi:hypothetical protein